MTDRHAPRLTGLALAAALIIAVCRLSREQALYPKSNRREMARAAGHYRNLTI